MRRALYCKVATRNSSVRPRQKQVAFWQGSSGDAHEALVFLENAPRILTQRIGNVAGLLVLQDPLRTGVVGHQRIVAAVEAVLEPAKVADGKTNVQDRILANRRFGAADVRLAPCNPGKGRRLELHQ